MSKSIIINISPLKCGTTAIYNALVKSKYVCKSAIKEPRFFADEVNENFSDIPFAMRYVGNYKNGYDWHESLFESDADCKYRIDFSPCYAVTRNTPQLIKKYYDDVKLVYILREPVERFVSHYYQYVKVGVKLPAINDVIDGESKVLEFLLKFSEYRNTYNRYLQEFGKDRICVIDFEDLDLNANNVKNKISRFLDIDDFDYAPSEKDKNKAGFPRFVTIQRILFSDFMVTAGRMAPKVIKKPLLRARRMLREFNTVTKRYDELDDTHRLLLEEMLSDEIEFYKKMKAKSC